MKAYSWQEGVFHAGFCEQTKIERGCLNFRYETASPISSCTNMECDLPVKGSDL